jgi:hypothetical protein
MGLFKSIGNFFKSTVGKVLTGVGAVLAAPFTAGVSLAAIPALFAAGRNKPSKESTDKLRELIDKGRGSKVEQPVVVKSTPPTETKVVQPEVILTKNEQIEVRTITEPKKTDVTLFGFYSTINKITIPVDNDLDNVVVVPQTFFPYIVVFENHPPSNGIRYISQFVYDNLQIEWGSNLGKVLHTLERGLSQYPYITLNWQSFVDKYNNFEADKLKRDGGVLYGFTVSPIFLLQWLDGPEPTTLLDYSYIIPPKVKTIGDLSPTQEQQPSKILATTSFDNKRADKLAKIVDSVSKVGATFAIAKAALGGIRSIYGNTKDSIKNLSDTAAKLGDKFKDLKSALSKDAINGKISDVKNLIKTKLPTPKNLKNLFLDFKFTLLAKRDLRRDLRLQKKKQRREAKDKGIKTKFSLKNFNLPELPEVPNIPSIPQLPKKINLNNLNTLPGLGKLPNVGSLISQGKGIVSGIGNINLKDPLSLLNAPANILNQASGLGDSVANSIGNTAQSILRPSIEAKNAQLAQQQRTEEQLASMRQDALKTLTANLAANKASLPTPTPLRERTGTVEVGNTTTFGG